MNSILETHPILNQTYFGNSLWIYGASLLLFLVLTLVLKLIQWLLLNRLKAWADTTITEIDDTLIKIVESLKPPFYFFVAFYLAIQLLSLTTFIGQVINSILIIWVVYQVIHAVQILIEFITLKQLKLEDENDARSAAQALSLSAKILLWSLGMLLVLSNIGVDVTSLIAGLGIGGIAVAFAVKDMLGDLFSSFTIYFDKPFRIGDFIVVGDKLGTVQKIGMKTTRIKSLQGEEIVIPNQKLTSELVQNYKRMEERRIEMHIGVAYETPVKKLKQIPQWIQEIISQQEKAEFKRAHLESFGDSSLVFEYIYVVLESDYELFMDINQAVNLSILEKFEQEKITIAYPTQTVYIKK